MVLFYCLYFSVQIPYLFIDYKYLFCYFTKHLLKSVDDFVLATNYLFQVQTAIFILLVVDINSNPRSGLLVLIAICFRVPYICLVNRQTEIQAEFIHRIQYSLSLVLSSLGFPPYFPEAVALLERKQVLFKKTLCGLHFTSMVRQAKLVKTVNSPMLISSFKFQFLSYSFSRTFKWLYHAFYLEFM